MESAHGFKSRSARLTGTVILMIAVLAAIAVFQYRSVRSLVNATRWLEHTDAVSFSLNSARSNLHGVSNAVHARVFGEHASSSEDSAENSTENVEPARAKLIQDLSRLRTLTSDNPRHQTRLNQIDVLVREQQSLLGELNAMLFASPGITEALERKLNSFDHVSAQIDGTISAMRSEETELMRSRTQTVRRTEVESIGVLCALLLVSVVGMLLIRGSLRSREAAEAEILKLNSELEQRVADRTRELAYQAELLDVAHDAIMVCGLDGLIKFWNKGAETIYGFTAQQALGKISRELLQTEFPGSAEEVYEVLKTTGTWEGELNHLRSDGTHAIVQSRWVLQETADGPRILEINTDITARKHAQRSSQRIEERFRLLVESVQDYGIFALDPMGNVTTWNEGAQRIKGYAADEIVGQHFSRFYPQSEIESGKPQYELKVAAEDGRFEDEGWRVRKDGSVFWANVIIAPLRDARGQLLGFSKVTRDLTERKMAEDKIAALNAEVMERNEGLLAANRELESFSYSVSHDLRSPLRSIDGFSAALLEEHSSQLDATGRAYLQRVRAAASRMGRLIDDMINLARTARAEMTMEDVNLSSLAREIADQLQLQEQGRKVQFRIQPNLWVKGDRMLLRAALENLLGNAWKFSAKKTEALIELGMQTREHGPVYFVRDNGAGFDMRYADKLFGVFQRLHTEKEFTGTGVGLATVQRIIHRHGGKIWGEGQPGEGATFHFELPPARTSAPVTVQSIENARARKRSTA